MFRRPQHEGGGEGERNGTQWHRALWRLGRGKRRLLCAGRGRGDRQVAAGDSRTWSRGQWAGTVAVGCEAATNERRWPHYPLSHYPLLLLSTPSFTTAILQPSSGTITTPLSLPSSPFSRPPPRIAPALIAHRT